MRHSGFLLSVAMTSLLSAGLIPAHAASGEDKPGMFYDPSNPASPTGKTIGHELFRTIGCPGRQLMDASCPAEQDRDGDGVADRLDKCPATPAGRKVNSEGCEIDSDGDGIVDGEDKCPAVYAKTVDGCPLPAPLASPSAPPAAEPASPAVAPTRPAVVSTAKTKLILDDVNFDNADATLRSQSYGQLDRAVEEIKGWGDGQIEVGGHADSRGSDEYNQDLSLQRAETVKRYLVEKGVAAEQLVVKGYGETQPVGDNETEAGRFQNRRVELQPMP